MATRRVLKDVLAKLKPILRKGAARTVGDLWTAVGRIVDTFTPAECANYVALGGCEADRSEAAPA